VVQTEFQEGGAIFSPDGQWIAYQSNKSGRSEIYLQPFPGPGADVQVSTTGGSSARWRRGGREGFHVATDDRLMAVTIRPAPTGSALELATPVPLFQSDTGDYMVAPDGQRFLLYVTSTPTITAPLSVILNRKPAEKCSRECHSMRLLSNSPARIPAPVVRSGPGPLKISQPISGHASPAVNTKQSSLVIVAGRRI